MGAILKGIEIPYHRGLHRFAIFTACATLVLIVAGALVTSNDAGLIRPRLANHLRLLLQNARTWLAA